MPSAAKVSWAQLRVGLMAVVALILLGALIFILTGNKGFFKSKAELYTFMGDSAAMTKGSAVRLNGILIGEVSSIELSGESKPGRIVKMTLTVDTERLNAIPVDSEVGIGAENLLGTKYINIVKGQVSQAVRAGAELKSQPITDITDLAKSAQPILDSLNSIVRRVDAIVGLIETGQGSIGKLLVEEELYNRIVKTVAEVQKIAEYMSSGRGSVGKLLYDDALYNDLRGSINKVDSLLVDLQQGKGTAGKLLKDPAVYDDTRQTIASIKKMVDDLNAGKGSAGKLLKSDELHNELMKLTGQLDTMMAKLNSGQGTLGQLLVNPQLYDSLNGTAREMNGLMKDFRANPKKFLRIKLALF